jgi:hypothetical protein
VPAIVARLRHPGGPGTARLRIDSLAIDCLDDLRRPLAPASYLARVTVSWNGAPVADVSGLPASGNRAIVPLATQVLEPGDSANVELRFDVSAAAPAGFLELVVPLDRTLARDVNSGAPAALATEPGGSLPLHSNLGRLTSPARNLAVGLVSRMPAALAADGRAVAAAALSLTNTDSLGAGAILVDRLVVRSADRALAARPLGAAAVRIEAWRDGVRWASSAALTPDSTTALLLAVQPLAVAPGVREALEIRLVTRTDAAVPSLRLGFDHDDIGVVEPASALLSVSVRPDAGLAFPLWTEAGALSAADLQSSYVNFPNPFAAGREATTIAYYLPGPARVSLRILTPAGDVVRTLIDREERPAGFQQADAWNGRNGRGDVVYNGVYVAELEVRLDGAAARTLRRKVAVVR